MHGAVACACHPIDSCPYTKAKAPTVCEDTVCSLIADFSSNMRLIIKINVTLQRYIGIGLPERQKVSKQGKGRSHKMRSRSPLHTRDDLLLMIFIDNEQASDCEYTNCL